MNDEFDEELLDGLDLEDQLDLLLDHSFKNKTPKTSKEKYD
jgi:hypothetical protein